jgi:tRNA threonylcarbamoyl adenosine modification protein (Sua5/YciO/YrdC/YwlC family)
MAQLFALHPTHPQKRLVRQVADVVRRGGLIAYPTDSCYALGCHLGDAQALARLRAIRGIDERHHLTLMCRDLSEIARYAMVSDQNYAFLRVPGSYTFILPARREVPRRVTRKKTIGVRIPGHAAAHALLAELGEPMLSSTLALPGDAAPLSDAQEIRQRLGPRLDLIIDAGPCDTQPSTVLDLTGAEPQVLRKGKGPLAPFSAEPV